MLRTCAPSLRPCEGVQRLDGPSDPLGGVHGDGMYRGAVVWMHCCCVVCMVAGCTVEQLVRLHCCCVVWHDAVVELDT
jgi:hypothetical protein